MTLPCILLGALVLRLLMAFQMPVWESADEYAHFWYARQIAETGQLPVAAATVSEIESMQPPLYYLVASMVFRIAPGAESERDFPLPPGPVLILLRLFAVLMGAATVWVAHRVLRALPGMTATDALWGTATVAFLPTWVGLNASVNNDTPVVLLSALCLLVALRKRWDDRTALLAGLLAGLALLTKMSAVILLPVVAYRLWTIRCGDCNRMVRPTALFLSAFALGFGLLLWRNLALYDTALVISPGLERELSIGPDNVIRAVRNLTWSFWLAFGRTCSVHPGSWVYLVTVMPLMLAAGWGWLRAGLEPRPTLRLGLIAVAAGTAASLWYTLGYPAGLMTSWGKNLYPVLPFIAGLLSAGWRRILPGAPVLVPAIAVGLMLAGCVWGLLRLHALPGGGPF